MTTLWTPGGEYDPSARSDLDKLESFAKLATASGRRNGVHDTTADRLEMGHNRRMSAIRKRADYMGDISLASGPPQDPMWYWQQNNLPYDYQRDEENPKIRRYAELIYITHPVIASCIDIFSWWPLTGMHLECKMDELAKWYEDHFFEDLQYEEYLPEVLKNYWLLGESFPLGQFNETMGIWDDDELVHPNDVKVLRNAFSRDRDFRMKIPEYIRKILQEPDRDNEWQSRKIRQDYPKLARFAQTNEFMPVSNVLMKHLVFKADSFHDRGLSMLMRAFRSIHQEEMLNSAVDSVASRLYTPLIIAKLGAPAGDLGTEIPWVPNEEEISQFEARLDAAMAAQFRVLITHFATSMESVFGREVMPDFSDDYDRLYARQLQAFGLSETALSGASNGETYAADALNLDLVSQRLKRAQKLVQRLFRERALVVAEAQGHYDYEERNGCKYPIMEQVLEYDEDGQTVIRERPKLLVPEMKFDVLNLQDENVRRQFIEALRASGVPISNQTRLTNIDIDLDEEYEKCRQEAVRLAIETQETRKETYLELRRLNLPVPNDLKDDFEPRAVMDDPPPSPGMGGMPGGGMPGGATLESEMLPLPNLVMDPPMSPAVLAPNPMDYEMGDDAQVTGTAPAQAPMTNAPLVMMPMNRNRPEESDEMRSRMPKPPPPVTGSLQDDGFTPAFVEPEEGAWYDKLVDGPRFASRGMRFDTSFDSQGMSFHGYLKDGVPPSASGLPARDPLADYSTEDEKEEES